MQYFNNTLSIAPHYFLYLASYYHLIFKDSMHHKIQNYNLYHSMLQILPSNFCLYIHMCDFKRYFSII